MANNASGIPSFLNGQAGAATRSAGITTKTFGLNLATGIALFTFELTAFLLLKSSNIGRRIYQPKTYLVQDRLRVEAIPKNPLRWLQRIFTIKGEELLAKCGLDGYFFIRFIRAMMIVFLPLMAIIVTVLLPINYHGGKDDHSFRVGDVEQHFNVTGLDRLSWQNVAPTQTDRYWGHLVCALLAISWALYRIYREKLHFIKVRQDFLSSPEHRLKASARTVLVTNIPREYRSEEALKGFFDVFVDNDDRTRLHVWANRDYKPLRKLVMRRRKLRHALEKEELRMLRLVNKQRRKHGDAESAEKHSPPTSSASTAPDDSAITSTRRAYSEINTAFDDDCGDLQSFWRRYSKDFKGKQVLVTEDGAGELKPVSSPHFLTKGLKKNVPKAAWLRFEIARCTVQIDDMLQDLENEIQFPRQNSAFIQFDRQMSANMACSLISHHLPGRMTPRFLDVAPHEVLWPNMGITSLGRFIRTCIAFVLFIGILVLWGIPTTFLGILSQLDTLRVDTPWLAWLRPWPSYLISVIAGPVSTILLALLVQLVVPALCRKLAVLVGAPTRSRREIITQSFYFAFLFIELVLVTSISSGLIATIPAIFDNPTSIPTKLATDLPKAANYFFNYLIIQGLGFSGSVLFQYLRVLYITTIWPWFTQTPREEAFLQTTIPHQMWGNVYPLITNFAVIGLIYSVIAPLMLIFVSGTFMLLWVAYRHNYYYVQRVKVDTHGMLFENALSQLFAGIYVLEITLTGLFFLVRNSNNNVACKGQAIIMIVAIALTAAFHYVMEVNLSPLYELLPVSLEDQAADAEKKRFLNERSSADNGSRGSEEVSGEHSGQVTLAQHDGPVDVIKRRLEKQKADARTNSFESDENAAEAAVTARETLSMVRRRIATKIANAEASAPGRAEISRRIEVGDQLGAALAAYPDELTDLSPQEREAELKVAYQDPITREPAPVIWIPQDTAGVSEDMLEQAKKYGKWVQYSNAGAFLSAKNKCEVVRPAPDVREDWLLEWVL